MTTAREDTTRLADLLRREHHALAEFLIALAAFDKAHRWVDLGHKSLFSFLRRELHLSAGAAQYRKTAAELIQRFPEVEGALREGRLCLSSVIELAKVITAENVAEVLPRFFGLSSRDAAFVAASATSRTRPCAISSLRPSGRRLRPPSRPATARRRGRAPRPRSTRRFGRPNWMDPPGPCPRRHLLGPRPSLPPRRSSRSMVNASGST